MISVCDRTVGDRPSSQDHHYPTVACGFLWEGGGSLCPAPGHDMGWDGIVRYLGRAHSAPGSTLSWPLQESWHCSWMKIGHGDTISPRLQDFLVFSWILAGVSGIALDRLEQGHIFLRTGLTDSSRTFRDTALALDSFQPKPLCDFIVCSIYSEQRRRKQRDFHVAGKSPYFKDK